jgi:hypothetical protein
MMNGDAAATRLVFRTIERAKRELSIASEWAKEDGEMVDLLAAEGPGITAETPPT